MPLRGIYPLRKLQPVEKRHFDVSDDNIRLLVKHSLLRLQAVLRSANDLTIEFLPINQCAKPLAHQRLVVCDQNLVHSDYTLDRPLVITKPVSIDGCGAHFSGTTPSGIMVYSGDVVLKNFTMDGFAMQRIYDKRLTTMSGGNLSIRDAEGNIWITPASIDKGTLSRKDIICVRPDGSCEGSHKPSSELPFHRSVYRLRPDLNAVLHAHPPALVAFSVVRKLPNLDLIPSVRHICRDVKFAAYAVPGSQELSLEIGKVFEQGCNIALLENHGVCVGAPDMFTAFQQFETINYTAELEVLAGQLGNIRALPENAYRLSETDSHTRLGDFISQYRSSAELAARRDMITLIRRSYKMDLFTATHGTYSVRLPDGSFLITPFGFDRAYLEEDDLVRVKGDAKELGKLPSRAVLAHRNIYRENPQIGAVLLAHPVHAMAFAVTDMEFDARTIPESYILLRDVKRVPYEELYLDLDKLAEEFDAAHPAAIVENDCVIVTGESLLQAFDRLEVMELTAASILKSQRLGRMVHISDEEVAALKKAYHLEG